MLLTQIGMSFSLQKNHTLLDINVDQLVIKQT